MKASTVRQAIREGGRDITFDQHPGLEQGEKVVLLKSRTKGPLRWAVVEWVRQPKPGVWTVRVRRYEVERPRLLRSGPLPYTDPERLREDRVHAPTPDEIAHASEDSHYCTSTDPLHAGQAVGDEWLKRFSADARSKRGEQITEAIEGR